MSTAELVIPIQRPLRAALALRGAQVLFLVPLGLLQLVAAIVFGITDDVQGGEYAIGAWGVTMAATGILVAVRLHRGGAGMWRLAFALLAAQTAFSIVKLTAYHEFGPSFVFFAVIASAAALLVIASDAAERGR
jgi:hypothetical protein